MQCEIDRERPGERDSVVRLLDDASAECARTTGSGFLTPSADLASRNDVLVARASGSVPGASPIYGVCVVRPRPGSGAREIAVLYVDPPSRGSGAGDSLLMDAVRLYGSGPLWAIIHGMNNASQDLFARHGFSRGAQTRPGGPYRLWTRQGA